MTLLTIFNGGESVLVNGAVFKTAREIAKVSLGGFDSHTPPPIKLQLNLQKSVIVLSMVAKIHSGFMTEQEFKDHTKQIALRVIQLVEELPNSQKARIIGNQLLDSSASIGANYLAACRGRSTEDLLHKLNAVEEEANKSLYWLEILVESKVISEDKLSVLTADLHDIVTMTASSINNLRSRITRDIKIKL